MEGIIGEAVAAEAGGGIVGGIIEEGEHIVNKLIDPTLDAAGEEIRDYLLPGHETQHPGSTGGGGGGTQISTDDHSDDHITNITNVNQTSVNTTTQNNTQVNAGGGGGGGHGHAHSDYLRRGSHGREVAEWQEKLNQVLGLSL